MFCTTWEVAASAMGERTYPWGDQAPTCDLARYDTCGQTSPDAVCSLSDGDSREGICDLSGNVAEWVQDWYRDEYYQDSPDRDPKGPRSGERRVARGGGWYSRAEDCRCAFRFSEPPDSRRGGILGLADDEETLAEWEAWLPVARDHGFAPSAAKDSQVSTQAAVSVTGRPRES